MIYLYALIVLSSLGGGLALLLLIADRFLADYGPCEISVNDEEPFVVEGGCTLLEALYEQEIFIPSACGGQGTCGFCKVNVFEGGGPVLPTEMPYLDKSELADNTRLACRIKVKQDVVLRVKPEYLDIQQFRSIVIAAKMVTHDTRHVVLKLADEQEINFVPGQYIQVQVPSSDGITFRAYSISSPPSTKDEVELVIRLIPDGLGSTYLHEVEVGEEVIFTGAYGEFVLEEDVETELICVGGGCGIAPMRSIIRHIGDVSPQRKCKLFFGVRTMEDIMYLEEFEQLADEMSNFEVHYALSDPKHSSPWQGERGYIHESVAKHVNGDGNGNRQAFLCGPPLMIEAVTKVLEEKNVPKDLIFYDEF
ncbi:MAG: 2Fe-2S iron-sulfur cluster binding domain-containing protein [Phycisphaerae bacterium]|nr:2Fe-2S iron-sulfur cluster binding domain-containing protein [Phycisphaerae bacterium]